MDKTNGLKKALEDAVDALNNLADVLESNVLKILNSFEHKTEYPNKLTFERTWKNATNPPDKIGPYWCVIEDVISSANCYYQLCCFYDPYKKNWTSDGILQNVIWWTELAPFPFE